MMRRLNDAGFQILLDSELLENPRCCCICTAVQLCSSCVQVCISAGAVAVSMQRCRGAHSDAELQEMGVQVCNEKRQEMEIRKVKGERKEKRKERLRERGRETGERYKLRAGWDAG